MENILISNRKRRFWRPAMLGLAVVLSLAAGSGTLHATVYVSEWTAYAMGNLSGGGGPIVQGVFATHYSAACPEDPSSYWPHGTFIQNLDYYVILVDGTGSAFLYDGFEKRDVGDLACRRLTYWVDVYFGRYKLPDDPCSCSGVPGVCYIGVDNSCTDAIQFGLVRDTRYIGPD